MFIAEVTSVYPKRVTSKQDLTGSVEVEIVHEAGTIDVKPAAHRAAIQGVRVLIPCAGTSSNVESGFVWLPSVGDWVVCGYLENYPDYAICFGTVRNPLTNNIPETGNIQDDYLIHHQTDSYLRMRNLEKVSNASSSKIRSEIKIRHKTGTEIELTEPSVGKCECNITHNSGATFKIDVDGNISVETSKIIKVTGKDVILGDESKATGVHTQQTHPYCFFTGAPFNGVPHVKAG
jgi:hypothetical protein